MANGLYALFKQNLGAKLVNMTVDDIRPVLSRSALYTVNLSTHQFLSDVPSSARIAMLGAALASPTFSLGVFATSNFVWTAVPSGPSADQVILTDYNGNGAAADTARMLISFMDTGITGMPVTPNGGNINVTVNASGWFA